MNFTIQYWKESFHLYEGFGSENQKILFSYPQYKSEYVIRIVSRNEEFIIPNEAVDRYNFSIEFHGLQKFMDNMAKELIIEVNPRVFEALIPRLKKIH